VPAQARLLVGGFDRNEAHVALPRRRRHRLGIVAVVLAGAPLHASIATTVPAGRCTSHTPNASRVRS